MELNWTWIAFGVMALVILGMAVLTAKGYGVLQIRWLNTSRLRDLQQRAAETTDPVERDCLAAIIGRCEALRSRWVMGETDLALIENTRNLVEEIARLHFPVSSQPMAEARIETILKSFLELKTQILQLTRLRGIREWTRFRLRHVVWLSEAWASKTRLEQTKTVQAVRRIKLIPIVKWAYTAFRALDLAFWTLKMSVFFLYDIVFKVFLIRWNLMVGETAMRLYSDHERGGDFSPEQLLEGMEELPDPKEFQASELTPEVRERVRESRNAMLFHPGTLNWSEARKRYDQLVGDIAQAHYPESERPLYEVRLYDLLLGFSRFAEQVVGLNTKPVINQMLRLRLSHVIKVKETADWALENQWVDLARKYKVGTAVKYTAMLYKVFKKGHPGILLKDTALVLAREAGKRWLWIYLHDKIAVEADWVYKPK